MPRKTKKPSPRAQPAERTPARGAGVRGGGTPPKTPPKMKAKVPKGSRTASRGKGGPLTAAFEKGGITAALAKGRKNPKLVQAELRARKRGKR